MEQLLYVAVDVKLIVASDSTVHVRKCSKWQRDKKNTVQGFLTQSFFSQLNELRLCL